MSTQEQSELATVVRSALAEFAPGGARWVTDPAADDPERAAAWRVLADELQLAGLTLPERVGGAGDLSDAMVVATELGRALLHTPFAASTIRASVLLAAAGEDELLAQISAGEAVVAVADTSLDDADSLGGDLGRVISASDATHLIVPVAGGARLLAIADASVERLASVDPGWPEDRVTLSAAPARRIDVSEAAVSTARSAVLLAYAAEAVGVASGALDQTVEFVKQRVQFGEPIGSFQAVQHAAADMFVQVETAAALSRESAIALGLEGVVDEALAATTYLYCVKVAQAVAGQAIQLQGGIGFTWEHTTHRFFKRAAALQSMPTTPAPQRERLRVALREGQLT